MTEQNENLEIKERKKGSWLFRIGIGLVLLVAGLALWFFFLPGDLDPASRLAFIGFELFLPASVGIFLISIHYFLKIRKKKGKIIWLGKIIIIFIIMSLIITIIWYGLEVLLVLSLAGR